MSPRYAFVCGLHRSGTSLLTQCLGLHPAISIFRHTGAPEDEGQHVQTVYPSARVHGGPGRFALDPAAHLTEGSDLVRPETARRLFEQWAPYWDGLKRVLVEKSPPNLIRTRFLQAMAAATGQRAAFIIILRHPLAVAMATRKWCREPVERLIEHWLIAHEIFEDDRPHLQRALTLRYEDLVQQPEHAMECVWSFLEIEPTPIGLAMDAGSNAKYFAAWRKITGGPAGGKRRERLKRRFGDRVAKFGYALE